MTKRELIEEINAIRKDIITIEDSARVATYRAEDLYRRIEAFKVKLEECEEEL